MIETERLKLISCQLKHFSDFAEGGDEQLAISLQTSIAKGWLVFPEAMLYGSEFLKNNPNSKKFWMYFFVLKSENKLIGNGGFKGQPDAHKMVEIGYAIAPEYRGKGLATEAARGLIEFAFSQDEVEFIQAHTLAEENDSVKVLRKVGMNFVKELHDDEDGDIWQWILPRNTK